MTRWLAIAFVLAATAACSHSQSPVNCGSVGSPVQGCGGGGSGGGVAVPSSTYSFAISGSTITATPNLSSLSTCTGTDLRVVWDCVIAAAPSGGRFFFKNGVYPINSLDTESATGCNSFNGSGAQVVYAVGIPAAAALTSGVQWLIEGESASVWQGEAGSTSSNTAGVIFNVTSTAVSSAAAGSFIADLWVRPLTNCTLSSTNATQDVRVRNITLRFPTNQRGNEVGGAAWFAVNVEWENVVADFALAYNSIATGSAPVVGTAGSWGLTSSTSNNSNRQAFRSTFVTGYNVGYAFDSEHIYSETSTAIYCNYPAQFGVNTTNAVGHSSMILHFNDQENAHGMLLGAQMSQGSRIDIFGLVIENGNDANWYSTTRGNNFNYTETNPNYTRGFLYYNYTVAGQGGPVIPSPSLNVFSSGGGGFEIVTNAQVPNFLFAPITDNFTRNNGVIGPAWMDTNTTSLNKCGFTISSNTAIGPGGGDACMRFSQTINADQFATATQSSLVGGVGVLVRASQTNNYYGYECIPGTGRQIRKRVAGTFTVLAGPVGTCVSASGDSIELQAVGSELRAFYTHAGVRVKDFDFIDTTFTSGQPGMSLGGTTDVISKWSGGSIVTLRGADSIYDDDSYQAIPRKTYVDTAAYTNATTTFSNVIGVGSTFGLAFTVQANTRYTMHCSIVWSASAATAGPQFQITGPASPTSVAITMASAITASTTASAAATAFSSALNPVGATVTSATNEWAQVDMELLNGANAGTVQLQAAAQGVGTLTIQPGSSCTLQ